MGDNLDVHIAALQAELAQVRAEMQEFTATVSHDLRAPLRRIVSYAQLVQEDAGPLLSAEVQDFLATITGSARHMGDLLDGLTTLSKLGSAPVVPVAVDVLELVREISDGLGKKHPKQALTWHVVGDWSLVYTDAALLGQLLTHVLGNAVKFAAPRDQAIVQISASPTLDPPGVEIRVRDNGVGYNPALQSKLFRVFGRLHSSQQFEGIGMGLVLSQKIAQRLGGTLAIEGVADGGCCVTLRLPST